VSTAGALPGGVPSAMIDGRAKLLLLREALRYRRAHGALFLDGEYLPLTPEGEDAGHVMAFARLHQQERLVCVVPRLVLQLYGRSRDKPIAWRARVPLPAPLRGPWTDLVTGRRVDGGEALDVGAAFADFPVALLAGS
jgi:(1->4)-alpha-D-glucan 1-alpha-D-glucosylmutase